MAKYQSVCKLCGSTFFSPTKDQKFCSTSCAYTRAKLHNRSILVVKYTPEEFQYVNDCSKRVKLPPDVLVKEKSLLKAIDVQGKIDRIKELEDQIAKLKALLSLYTSEFDTDIDLKDQKNQ